MFAKLLNRQDSKQPNSAENNKPAFPVLGIIFAPYTLFMDNSRTFFKIAGWFALLMTVIFMLLGQNTMCTFPENSLDSLCSRSIWGYLVSRLIGLYLVAMFSMRLYRVCYNGAPLSFGYLLRPRWIDLKAALAYVVFLLLNMISLLSAYLLYIRVPNPDWRIELTYFGVISIGFLVPFFLLRFYSLWAFVFAGEKLPSIREVWKRTSDNGLRLLLSFALLFCVLVFSLNAVIGNFRLVASENTIYISFIAEYVFNLILLANVMFFINLCQLQKQFLFGKE